MPIQVLNSTQDSSVNFVEQQLEGFLESRYVRKCDERFIAYLSSQTGCNRSCKFCHLTVTGQTSFSDSSHNDFLGQALQVFKHYRQQKPATYMHYSFMARGEPLCNKTIIDESTDLFSALGHLALDEGLPSKFNVSTIIPVTLKKSLIEIFPLVTPMIYYSIYSVNEAWRKEWLPTAMPAKEALRMLKEYQQFSKKFIKIHCAFIKDENDSEEDLENMCKTILDTGLFCEFNLVRYNPASPAQGEESSEDRLKHISEYMHRRLGGKAQIIPRVGFDVSASCGMFAGRKE